MSSATYFGGFLHIYIYIYIAWKLDGGELQASQGLDERSLKGTETRVGELITCTLKRLRRFVLCERSLLMKSCWMALDIARW